MNSSLDTPGGKERMNIISKYAERLATKESLAIDNFIKEYIPNWQIKIMKTFPITKKLFGWRIVHKISWDKSGKNIILERYGQNVAELKIIRKIKLV